MRSGFDNFIALETELSQKLEERINLLRTRRWYGYSPIVLFSISTFFTILSLLSSLFQRVTLDFKNAFPIATPLTDYPLFGGFIVVIGFGLIILLSSQLSTYFKIHERPYYVWLIWLYSIFNIFILLIIAYQTRPFTWGTYGLQVLVWFIFSVILLTVILGFIQFCMAFMPQVSWLWFLSVARSGSRSPMFPSYMELLKATTAELNAIQGWDQVTWEQLRAFATTRLTAANSHTQAASFILAAIAFIGILPTIASRAWEMLRLLVKVIFDPLSKQKHLLPTQSYMFRG